MDGFDVGGLQVGKAYDVDPALGVYLMVAGYATAEGAAREPRRSGTKRRPQATTGSDRKR